MDKRVVFVVGLILVIVALGIYLVFYLSLNNIDSNVEIKGESFTPALEKTTEKCLSMGEPAKSTCMIYVAIGNKNKSICYELGGAVSFPISLDTNDLPNNETNSSIINVSAKDVCLINVGKSAGENYCNEIGNINVSSVCRKIIGVK